MQTINYRPLQPGEETAVCDLIASVFNAYVAPDYEEKGNQEFFKYANPEAMSERVKNNHFVLVAAVGDRIVGMIEMRDFDHLSLLFVDSDFHRRGISRELLRQAVDICRENRPDMAEVLVNSSPFAIPVYEKLGFRITGPEQTVNGIRFQSMVLTVE